jgi:xanthine/uracil permease
MDDIKLYAVLFGICIGWLIWLSLDVYDLHEEIKKLKRR